MPEVAERADQRGPTDSRSTLPSPKEYAEFIGQIELRNIWLVEATAKNHFGPHTPTQAVFRFASTDATWENASSGFRVKHCYELRIESEDEMLAEVDVTFGLEFESSQPITDDIFKIFKDVNLPVNTWPYLREFIATTTGRMGWAPFTAPTFKSGVKPAKRRARRRTQPAQPANSEK